MRVEIRPEVNDALQLSVEQMAREIRTGHDFNANPPSKLIFRSAQERAELEKQGDVFSPGRGNDPVVFYKLENDGAIYRHAPGGKVKITPDNIEITNLDFNANGIPILITIVIQANPVDKILQGNYEVNIQTSVSPRGI